MTIQALTAMHYFSIRSTCFYGFCLTSVLLALSFYFQQVMGLEPCSLCIVQRLVVAALAIIFLLGLLCTRRLSVRIHSGALMIVAGTGIVAAARQVWLQQLPANKAPACGPGINYILQNYKLSESIKLIFQGSGDCATVPWSLLGLSMSGWLLIIFTSLILVTLLNFLRA